MYRITINIVALLSDFSTAIWSSLRLFAEVYRKIKTRS